MFRNGHPHSIRSVFLDAGGTLFRPYPSVGEIYAGTAARFGGTYDADALELEFNTAWNRRGGLSSLGASTSKAKERAWWHSLVAEVFAPHGGVPNFEAFFEELYLSFEESRSWEIYPEVIEVLTKLRERGIRLTVVSNWDLRLPKLLKNLGLEVYFDHVIGSSACGTTKPQAGIFKAAMEEAGVGPHEVVHVGDSYEEDYLGARALGICALLLDRSGTNRSAPRVARISCLGGLRKWLDMNINP